VKRLFVCCDGTCNSSVDRKYGMPVSTDVYKFFNDVVKGKLEEGAITQMR
jgi:hypothetical protein